MLQRWLRPPYRLSILACLAAGILASLYAGHAAGPLAQASLPWSLMAACALLPGALALLLWRQHRQFQRQRTLELLRADAEQTRLASAQRRNRKCRLTTLYYMSPRHFPCKCRDRHLAPQCQRARKPQGQP